MLVYAMNKHTTQLWLLRPVSFCHQPKIIVNHSVQQSFNSKLYCFTAWLSVRCYVCIC